MSLKKSVTRRLSWLAVSSLATAGLSASLGLALAPGAAQAQSVCTPAPTTGAGTNSVAYTGNQTTGVTCTATGAFTLTKTSGTVSSTTSAITLTTTGAATVINTGTVGGVNFNMPNGTGAVNFSGVAGGVTFTHAGTTNTAGRWLGSGASVFSAGADVLNFSGIGLNYLGGRNLLSTASIDFGAGADTLNVSAFFNMGAFTQEAGSIDFGTEVDTYNLSGVFSSHGGTLANLEAFNNSGLLLMGVSPTPASNPLVNWTTTDRIPDDVLRINGATFTGSGASRIVMDVYIGGGQQPGCATLTGVADCLDIRGGSTAGVTVLTLNNLGDDALQVGYDLVGTTLVDVAGTGTSAASHFVLDPATPTLMTDPRYGTVLNRPGLFFIALRYDAVAKRHALVGLPRGEVFEYAMLSSAAQSVWHMTAKTVTDRQTDLRAGAERAVWVRASGEYAKNDTSTTYAGVGETFTIDNSYKLYAGALIGGMDVIVGRSGAYDYAAGVQVGYVSSSFDLDAAPSSGRFTGATGGVYVSLWSDWFFLDGTVNANGLTLDFDQPRLGTGLGTKTNTFLNSVGGRAEAGVRAKLTETTFAEPLLTVAYARTSFEEIFLDGGVVSPADAKSLRGALGLRLGGTLAGPTVGATYFVTGRTWEEFQGDNGGVVRNPGADLPFSDEFAGVFGEAELGVNVYNTAGSLSGYLTSGVKFKDGYSAVNLSLGVRMAW